MLPDTESVNAVASGEEEVGGPEDLDMRDPKSEDAAVADSQKLSPLESLPAELKDRIFRHIPDLPTLRSLVHTSPAMHAHYQSNRDALLLACLERELDGFVADACACVKSRVSGMRPARTDAKITKFLDRYSAWLHEPGRRRDLRSLHPSARRWLAAFHLGVAGPLSRRFADWALANLEQASASSTGRAEGAPPRHEQVALSRSEETRIFRALYRYETFCHLFGVNNTPRSGEFRHHEINQLFFCLFDPWEAEAIGCIDLFLRQRYGAIFEEVRSDLRDRNPKIPRPDAGPKITSFGLVDLDDEYETYMDGTVSRGLKVAVRVLAIHDHEALVDYTQRCLSRHYTLDDTMKAALSTGAQKRRREMPGTLEPADEAEWRRDPIAFAGDDAAPHAGGPPLGWALLWGGVYSNVYGEYVPEPLRKCGYVVWDARRWDELAAREFVTKQWASEQALADAILRDFAWCPGDG